MSTVESYLRQPFLYTCASSQVSHDTQRNVACSFAVVYCGHNLHCLATAPMLCSRSQLYLALSWPVSFIIPYVTVSFLIIWCISTDEGSQHATSILIPLYSLGLTGCTTVSASSYRLALTEVKSNCGGLKLVGVRHPNLLAVPTIGADEHAGILGRSVTGS